MKPFIPESRWWKTETDGIRCLLCHHVCLLSENEYGICGVRKAVAEGIELSGFGMISAEASDPIEKKPLYHFYPGSRVWSIGFTGCNMDCPFCQNHSIARAQPSSGHFTNAQEIINHAVNSGSGMLAYTYSEPTVHIEYLIECAEYAHEAGLKNILVTNGCLNPHPAVELLKKMDAVNIDLKSWNAQYYKAVLGGNLSTVLKFIEAAIDYCWVELTTLIVPGDNDADEDIRGQCDWIAALSKNIPLHLSAYHPSYKYKRKSTSLSTINRVFQIAVERLNYVYIGNMGNVGNNTLCPECKTVVIHRDYYRTVSNLINGQCRNCGTMIHGVFPNASSRRLND